MRLRLRRVCRCGHFRDSHTGSSGPWSNGRYNHGECTVGSRVHSPYRIGGCDCYGFDPRFFPRLVVA